MALGRLLMAGIVISTAACSSNTPYYAQMSTAKYDVPNSVYGLVYNWGKYNAYSVPTEDRERHERCVFFALDTLQVGEACDWAGPQTGASGKVMIATIDPNGCHTLFSSVFYRGKSKNFQERACLRNNKWNFYH